MDNSSFISENAELYMYCSSRVTTASCVCFLFFDALIFLSITIGNTLVVVSVVRFTNMRSPTNIFLASLAFADLFVAVFCIPFDIALTLGVVSDVSLQMCLIGSQLTGVSFTLSINHLTVVAYDRFVAITRPLHYRGHMTTNRIKLLIFTSWAIAILFNLLPSFGWNCLDTYELGYCDLLYINALSYRCASVFVMAFIPFALIGYFYLKIFQIARQQRRRIWAQAQAFKHGGQHNLSLELKAAKTVGIVMGIFILDFTPASLVACADVFFPVKDLIVFKVFSFHLVYSNSAMNPVAYAFRSKEFRRAFVKLLGSFVPCRCWQKLSQRPTGARVTSISIRNELVKIKGDSLSQLPRDGTPSNRKDCERTRDTKSFIKITSDFPVEGLSQLELCISERDAF